MQHAHGHQEALAAALPPIPDHPLIPQQAPEVITTAPALASFLAHVREQRAVAYDTEFIGEQSYEPRICLIQLATRTRLALVDPLADLDLADLWRMLADPSVAKVVHAGQQDLEPIFRYTGEAPRNVFDTQVAAAFVGLDYPISLARLVERFVGVELGKGLKFSQWDQRPLSAVQLHYASSDVRYLLRVQQELLDALQDNGNHPRATEQCLGFSDPQQYQFDATQQMARVRGSESLQPGQAAVLRELVTWRDAAAREHNVPPRTLLRDPIMLELSREPVLRVGELSRVRGLPRPVLERHSQRIIEATRRGLATDPAQWPTLPRLDDASSDRELAEPYWQKLLDLCEKQQVAPGIVISKKQFSRLCRQTLREQTPLEQLPLQGWRRELIASALPPAAG